MVRVVGHVSDVACQSVFNVQNQISISLLNSRNTAKKRLNLVYMPIYM